MYNIDMKEYKLSELYTRQEFEDIISNRVEEVNLTFSDEYEGSELAELVANSIYYEFFDDYVLYTSDEEDDADAIVDVQEQFAKRIGYDVAVKYPYWYIKYHHLYKLYDEELSLLQSSKMTSSSTEKVDNVSGSLQRTASTPTSVSTDVDDNIDITIDTTSDSELDVSVESDGFVKKYTNYQGKSESAGKTNGSRNSTITREGSIDDLLKVLEKLPSSFTDEICKSLAHHFKFVYDYGY